MNQYFPTRRKLFFFHPQGLFKNICRRDQRVASFFPLLTLTCDCISSMLGVPNSFMRGFGFYSKPLLFFLAVLISLAFGLF